MLADLHDEAANAILALLASEVVPSQSAELALLYSDNAFALAKQGRFELAAQMAAAAASIDPQAFDADDQAILFDGLARYFTLAGKEQIASDFRVRSESALAQQQATIAKLTQLLQPFASGPVRPT